MEFPDFPVRRDEFPVLDHRGFIATGAETLGKLGSDSVSGVEFLRISRYIVSRLGKTRDFAGFWARAFGNPKRRRRVQDPIDAATAVSGPDIGGLVRGVVS